MRYVTLDELRKRFYTDSYEEFYEKVIEGVNKGTLIPVKRSKFNGMNPPLKTKYLEKTAKEKDEEALAGQAEVLNNELWHLNRKMKAAYYFKNLPEYVQDREDVLALSAFLDRFDAENEPLLSVNERCYEIWQDEKKIEIPSRRGARILSNCGLTLSDLGMYQTSEPLAYYSRTESTPQTVLFIENEDPYYGLCRHLRQGSRTVLGRKIDTIVYGAGKRISRQVSGSLSEGGIEQHIFHGDNTLLYWGDIDYAGVEIFDKLRESIPSLQLFPEAYIRMVRKSRAYPAAGIMKEKQSEKPLDSLRSILSAEDMIYVQDLLEHKHFIPQEILNVKDY